MADDGMNVVNLDAARVAREVEAEPELELVLYVTMAKDGCSVQLEPTARSVVDMDDPETMRRVCLALNTMMHMFMKKYRLKTLKPQRARLRRKPDA